MQDNITALNIEEGYKNNKTIKVVPGKHAKPAKLSSGQTFKTKTAAIMEKVNAPAPVEAPAPAPQEVAPQVPEQTEVATQPTEVAPAAPITSQTTPISGGTDLPADDIVLSKINNLNITYVEPTNAKDAGSRRLKISSAVVTRSGNTFKVMVKNAPVVATPATEVAAVAPETPTTGEVTPAPVPEVPAQTVPSPEVAEVATPDAMMTPDSGFFLGQKLNTETNENGETEVTPVDTETEEVTEEVEGTTPEITQEEKDERLNQILNSNQGNIVDFASAKKALEELAERRNAISQLNKEMEEARRIRENQNQELQQLLADAPRMLDDLDKEKMSRTEELSNLRAEIIQYDDLIKQNRGFQGNQDEYEEEISYGRSRG